ncbi:prepilin-type N-terminal cleavage/methylation domain-containing protein, partial [Escherichia coli]|nr:prepilin-type N-terminal cleavage/methylation domain-containing protein [Escherichia coli]MWT87598.1 prepilin-type N-terminal cleavage/methylation domain-containing protein [Escherichia coli]
MDKQRGFTLIELMVV